MSRLFRIISLLLGLFVLFASAFAQETIKVDTTLVSVPVIVSERNGRYVPGLKEKDFTLYQDGVKQTIGFFAATEEPFNVALMLDTSLSTAPVLKDIQHAAKDFIKQLRSQDRAMIVSFDHNVQVLSQFTSDRHTLENAIEEAQIGKRAGTVMRDALWQVIEQNFKPLKGRKAIVLLTDGKDHGSQMEAPELLKKTAEADVLIYSVFYLSHPLKLADNAPSLPRGGMGGIRMGRRDGVFGPRFPPAPRPDREARREQRRQKIEARNEPAKEFLQELAEGSAGRYYRSETTNLKKTFELIAEELRHQYRLGFYPPEDGNAGKLHKLKVEVAKADVVVRARHDYRKQ